ncbi:hypothetical protein GMORB2_4969 [Geosmithia morbida]|uniref:Uncharacterized protein n=1 Tax=Geosmithia morbida TaxID=1094350 RepID=A0A9P4YZ36_9HYPO|nr:uncharacterized protein GMORB2_4969 [Geosmithia morbida]KAF4124303.1 hypothetical protein GMORB2_4969 [Geosmithia morbida]
MFHLNLSKAPTAQEELNSPPSSASSRQYSARISAQKEKNSSSNQQQQAETSAASSEAAGKKRKAAGPLDNPRQMQKLPMKSTAKECGRSALPDFFLLKHDPRAQVGAPYVARLEELKPAYVNLCIERGAIPGDALVRVVDISYGDGRYMSHAVVDIVDEHHPGASSDAGPSPPRVTRSAGGPEPSARRGGD